MLQRLQAPNIRPDSRFKKFYERGHKPLMLAYENDFQYEYAGTNAN